MQMGGFKFDRVEFAGSLGDLGTLIPLSVAMMVINGLSVTPVLMMIAFFYIASGVYYRLPIPVQPLKVVAAISVAYPEVITMPTIAASGLIFGMVLLLLAATGIIDRIAALFTRPIMRGIQLGLGFLLMTKGIKFILKPSLFMTEGSGAIALFGVPLNGLIGVALFVVALLLISSRRYPAALVLVAAGIVLGGVFGSFPEGALSLGPTSFGLVLPGMGEFYNALILLVIPQIPLTLGNAVMGTTDTCYVLFGKGEVTKKVSNRAFAMSMALANMAAGCMGAMPMCHGAGGLAAHYRFGARTGGSNIMIGLVFLVTAIGFGKIGITLLSSIPNAVLGVLLLFAGLELALFIRDIEEKNDLFIAILIAVTGFATTNMGIAFFTGIIVMNLMKWRKISL